MTVRIVTVCTGNICRSPYAQLLLAHRLVEIRPGAFEVSSLGTSALIDQGVDPGSARLLEAAGIAYHGFLARQISEQLLADIDLVLPLTVEHRRLVLSYAPQLLKRTFTLKEMARLIASADSRRPWSERLADAMTPQERWSTITAEIVRERGMTRVEDGADDVADPYRRGDAAFDTMGQEIAAAVATIVELERLGG